MAVTKTATKCALQIKVQSGLNPDGSTKYSTRSLGVINTAVTDDKLYAFGALFGALQSHPVDGLFRVDTASLAEE